MKITEITIRRATELDAQQISASQIAQTLHDMEIDIAVHLAG